VGRPQAVPKDSVSRKGFLKKRGNGGNLFTRQGERCFGIKEHTPQRGKADVTGLWGTTKGVPRRSRCPETKAERMRLTLTYLTREGKARRKGEDFAGKEKGAESSAHIHFLH